MGTDQARVGDARLCRSRQHRDQGQPARLVCLGSSRFLTPFCPPGAHLMFKYFMHAAAITAALSFTQSALAQDTAPMPDQSAAMAATAPRDPSLKPVFDEFGGKPGLVALMNDFMDNLMADARTRPYFVDSDREHIKVELVDQFCVILDG